MTLAAPAADPRTRAIDGLVPRRVVETTTVDDVARAIRDANEAREGIVLWGGGTRIGIGDVPERYDVALDLRGLRGIVDLQPDDLTVTVLAGTTLAQLAEALRAHGKRWPVEVAHPDRATVGGTIASAATGPSRYRYFHPRDWTIGCRAVLGDGTVTRAGGRVVKNVTGYDLTKLYSGTYGTLCALVELTLKLAALPERTVTLRIDFPHLRLAYRWTREFLRLRLPLDAVALVTGDVAQRAGSPTWTSLFVRLSGSDAVIGRIRGSIDERYPAEEATSDVWRTIADLPADADTSVRASWPAGQPAEIYPANAVWYPGVEWMHLLDEQDEGQVRGVRGELEGQAGSLVLERVPTSLRRAAGTWGTPRVPLAIARALRERFDPRSVLAPGRMP